MLAENVSRTAGEFPVEVRRRGSGHPLMYLHSEIGSTCDDAFLEVLAREYEVIAPVLPGFDGSAFAAGIDSVDDLSYLCLDRIRALGLRDVLLLGSSLGGWVAAETAVKSTEYLAGLVLIDSFGIRVNARETRDIVDIFGLTERELASRSFFDSAYTQRNYAEMADAELLAIVQNREAAARYGWSPYMHNPKLKNRLRRIDVPTLVLWGAADQIVTPEYGRTFAAEIPSAEFVLIDQAGHYPQVERPDGTAEAIRSFAASIATLA